MTYRDEVPKVPTCPVCATRERVQRERDRWLCGGCWTVFTGSQDEWERSRVMREAREAIPVQRPDRREREDA